MGRSWVPLRSVATITIPKQEIDTPDSESLCESLFFTPGHALPEHRPIGGINRLRLAVYLASVDRRRRSSPANHMNSAEEMSRARSCVGDACGGRAE